ncbi:hypothetical protein C8Q79DRAFT_924741 [Trametes meyenii]|nr:hypothetical protein C8Q79DRAFT_924741 [Trametes meyenii]
MVITNNSSDSDSSPKMDWRARSDVPLSLSSSRASVRFNGSSGGLRTSSWNAFVMRCIEYLGRQGGGADPFDPHPHPQRASRPQQKEPQGGANDARPERANLLSAEATPPRGHEEREAPATGDCRLGRALATGGRQQARARGAHLGAAVLAKYPGAGEVESKEEHQQAPVRVDQVHRALQQRLLPTTYGTRAGPAVLSGLQPGSVIRGPCALPMYRESFLAASKRVPCGGVVRRPASQGGCLVRGRAREAG